VWAPKFLVVRLVDPKVLQEEAAAERAREEGESKAAAERLTALSPALPRAGRPLLAPPPAPDPIILMEGRALGRSLAT
jgi:hypothetical protein